MFELRVHERFGSLVTNLVPALGYNQFFMKDDYLTSELFHLIIETWLQYILMN